MRKLLLLLAIPVGLWLSMWTNIPAAPVAHADTPKVLLPIAPVSPVAMPSAVPVAPPEEQVPPPPAVPPKPIVLSSHERLMAAAGISKSDWGAAEYIIGHESGWRASATNPSSHAHGLPQALPYSKTGCGWVDDVCQLKWADAYSKSRYGGWWNAQSYWSRHHNW